MVEWRTARKGLHQPTLLEVLVAAPKVNTEQSIFTRILTSLYSSACLLYCGSGEGYIQPTKYRRPPNLQTARTGGGLPRRKRPVMIMITLSLDSTTLFLLLRLVNTPTVDFVFSFISFLKGLCDDAKVSNCELYR